MDAANAVESSWNWLEKNEIRTIQIRRLAASHLRSDVEHAVMSLGKRALLARQALNHLYKKPFISAGDLASALGVSTPTINTLIRELMAKGILIETMPIRLAPKDTIGGSLTGRQTLPVVAAPSFWALTG